MRIWLCGMCLVVQVGAQSGQAPATLVPGPASFEIASIKLNTSEQTRQSSRFLPGYFEARNLSLRVLIQYAYALANFQPVQGKSSILDQRFDIKATTSQTFAAPGPRGSIGPINVALQKLLAERFNLLIHHEKRAVDGYALVLARADRGLGPKLRPSSIDCASLRRAGGPLPVRPDGTSQCSIVGRGNSFMLGDGNTLAEFASSLEIYLGGPLEDRTGLMGPYEFDLTKSGKFWVISREEPVGMRPGPDLNAALREQLGLQLQRTRLDVDFVVVDRADPLTEN
jgi:uncharacterized protein (TIGR03435 family)